MENPFLNSESESQTSRVLKIMIDKKKGDFACFNYQEIKMDYEKLRPTLQYVMRKYLNNAKYKTKHTKDKSELWVTII